MFHVKQYIVTEKAGRFVAGRNNVGVGTVLELTPREAEYELTLGTLRAVDDAAQRDQTEQAGEALEQEAQAEETPKRASRKKAAAQNDG
jgi:hypothetical protein